MATLTESLREELVITAVVIVLFLLHFSASLVVAVTLPMAVLMSFIGMQWFQLTPILCRWRGFNCYRRGRGFGNYHFRESSAPVEWEASRTAQGHAADGVPLQPDQRTRTDVIIDATNEMAPAIITGVSTTICRLSAGVFLNRPGPKALRSTCLDEDVRNGSRTIGRGISSAGTMSTSSA